MVIDELSFDSPKTRDMVSVIKHLDIQGDSLLVATDGYDVNVYKSGRNIARVSVSPAAELNALDVLSARRLLVTKAALDALRARAGAGGKSAAESKSSDAK